MVALTQDTGSDAPVYLREDDHLGRWIFAREIYHIATQSPLNWSIRVGVYGKWGSGKTSILKFIEQMAMDESHIAVWFNPWQYNDQNGMWRGFLEAIRDKLNNIGISMPNQKQKKLKAIASKTTGMIEKVSKATTTSEIIASASLPFINCLLSFNSSDLIKIPDVLGKKRLIILIDDLDRTNPNLVPNLLYMIREVLYLSRFNFILAFDPKVVGNALQEYHSGWGSGIEFLEKIIDFPRWIPSPTKEALWSLAEADVKKYCPYVDLEAMRQVFDYFPENPRTLRMFIRHLWSLELEVKRHKPEELNWIILFLVNLLKASSPDLVQRIFNQEEIVKKLTLISIFSKDNKHKNNIDELVVLLQNICKEVGIEDEIEKNRTIEIVKAICTFSNILSAEPLKYHAFLTERPHSVTWKEYDAFYKAWKANPKASTVKKWLEKHTSDRGDSQDRIFLELYKASITKRLIFLERAANTTIAKELESYAKDAQNTLKLLDILSFRLGGFTNEPPLLGSSHFKLVLDMIGKWIHFRNQPVYVTMRAKERKFLLKIAEKSSIEPEVLLECLSPWSSLAHSFDHEGFRVLVEELVQIIEPRVAKKFIRRFTVNGGINSLWEKQKHNAERYVLFRKNSPMWSKGPRVKFLKIAKNASKNRIVQENLIEFILMLSEGIKGIPRILSEPQLRDLINDKEIIDAAWIGALKNPLNPRVFSTFKKVHKELKKVTGRNFKVPSWWDSMDKEVSKKA